jgi:GT2 family glycosyltransferase
MIADCYPAIGASVAVIIVNWNGWRHTLAACRSVAASTYRNCRLIIVDNASTDESVTELERAVPDAILIRNPINAGFAGGCNRGIERGLELGSDYVFLLNSDAEVDAHAIARLVAASAALGDRAILGSVVRLLPSGTLQFFGSRRSPGRGRPEWYEWPRDADRLRHDLIGTDLVFGAALFAPSRMCHEVGLLDERFFLNYEESDWCYRAAARGISLQIVGASLVHHHQSASLGALDAPMQTYFMQRNRLLFYDKHGALHHRLRAYAEMARYLALCLTRDLRRGSIDPSTHAFMLAIRDYLFRRFGDCPPIVRELARAWPPVGEETTNKGN